jgi:hypothetical protein
MRAFVFVLLASTAVALGAEPGASTWYSIAAENGAQIGYASQETVNAPDGGRTVVDSQAVEVEEQGDPSPLAPWFSVPRASHMTWRTQTTEDAQGRAVAIVSSARNGDDWSKIEAHIDGAMRGTARGQAKLLDDLSVRPDVTRSSGDDGTAQRSRVR